MIHAAGGVVWRRGSRGPEIAIVRRTRYGDEWTLPKGKLQDHESWEAAAVREVHEETGCVVERGPFAGVQIYKVDHRPKVVVYWHMVVVTERSIPAQEEVKELQWLAPTAAQARLTHSSEQRLLAEALRNAPPFPMSSAPRRTLARLWRALSPASPLERLADTLPAYRHELDLLIQITSTPQAPAAWATQAAKLLHETEQAVRDRNPEGGWRLFLATQRLELYGLRALGPEAFRARASSIRTEALQKLRSWRRKQVEQLFPSSTSPNQVTGPVSDAEFAAATEAALLLHEHFGNETLKHRSGRTQVRVLVLIAAVAVLWFWFVGPAVLVAGNDFRIDDTSLLLSALLFGLMGAAFSALTSLFTQTTSQTIPEQAFSYRITLARQAVGVLSALVVYVSLASGFISVANLTLTPPLLLVFAFAAGFSERLVIRALHRFASSSKGPGGDTTNTP